MTREPESDLARRDFLKISALAVGAAGGMSGGVLRSAGAETAAGVPKPETPRERYNTTYEGPRLNRIAFPMGGFGTGMVCLEGTGGLSAVSLYHRPAITNQPCVFAAVSVRGAESKARVVEGPVPGWKLFGLREAGNGLGGSSYGLPRYAHAKFAACFPFGKLSLTDEHMPLDVEMTGWNPFTPGDADNSSLPVAGLEYRFANTSAESVDAVFSFNARNFMAHGDKAAQAVRSTPGGFILWGAGEAGKAWQEGSFAIRVDEPEVKVNHQWFRGGWFDPLTIAWKDVASGACFDRPPVSEGEASPGGTLFVPFQLEPGATRTIVVKLGWYVPRSEIHHGSQGAKGEGESATPATYEPWYAGRFASIEAVAEYWKSQYVDLRGRSERFADAFYDSTLPPEVIEAVAANLTILKTTTVMRQKDGRFWGYEGTGDDWGCCHGSCTHVWNYAQAVAHLFPELERTLRETEFGPDQDAHGHQQFRAALPIRPIAADFYAAADGQLGGIMKMHRDWLISGDTGWLRGMWPKVRQSLEYCIETWDPERRGWVEEPHHNTYDIEFWGPDGMCTSFYLGALKAAVIMGRALDEDVAAFESLYTKGVARVEAELFDGEYFFQKIEWKNLRATKPGLFQREPSPEARALREAEGPKYQYGTGCLSDGVLGSWIALVCGVGQVLDRGKVANHLRSVHRYNLKHDLSEHANPQRPSFACGNEGGLLLCTWPKGGALSLPFVYSNEVWTGIEYQVASHLLLLGMANEGLEVVRTCRDRYDGRIRNPFDEYECGHWYARALASYGLLQGLSGARYDAVERVLHLEPSIPGDFRCFLSTASGYGVVGVADGKPFLDVRSGAIEVKEIIYTPAGGTALQT